MWSGWDHLNRHLDQPSHRQGWSGCLQGWSHPVHIHCNAVRCLSDKECDLNVVECDLTQTTCFLLQITFSNLQNIIRPQITFKLLHSKVRSVILNYNLILIQQRYTHTWPSYAQDVSTLIPSCSSSNVMIETDTQTDLTEIITYPHTRCGISIVLVLTLTSCALLDLIRNYSSLFAFKWYQGKRFSMSFLSNQSGKGLNLNLFIHAVRNQ